MKYIEGTRLTDYLDACDSESEEGKARKDALMKLIIDHYCEAILRHGFFQADPHPGNFLVTEEGKLAVIDFGSMGTLSDSQRKAYINLISAALQRNTDLIAQCLDKMGFSVSDPESDILTRYAQLILDIFNEEATHNIDTFDSAKQMKKLMELSSSTRNVKVPSEFVLLGRTLIALGGLIMHYKPNLNLFEIIAPHLQSAFQSAR